MRISPEILTTTAETTGFRSWRATGIPVVNLHELAAGKLSALLARRTARDLFDSRMILTMDNPDLQRLRLAFIVHGAMNCEDWRTVSVEDADVNIAELVNQLVPSLHIGAIGGRKEATTYAKTLIEECRQRLSAVLPFTDTERAFLDLLLDWGRSTRQS